MPPFQQHGPLPPSRPLYRQRMSISTPFLFFSRVAIQKEIPPSRLWAPLMDVMRLLNSLPLLFCTMVSEVDGSKTLPMDQPIFTTKSIYHGCSLLYASASSTEILFSFIFSALGFLSIVLVFEAHCCVEMLRVHHYTHFPPFLPPSPQPPSQRQTGWIMHSQLRDFCVPALKSSSEKLPRYMLLTKL